MGDVARPLADAVRAALARRGPETASSWGPRPRRARGDDQRLRVEREVVLGVGDRGWRAPSRPARWRACRRELSAPTGPPGPGMSRIKCDDPACLHRRGPRNVRRLRERRPDPRLIQSMFCYLSPARDRRSSLMWATETCASGANSPSLCPTMPLRDEHRGRACGRRAPRSCARACSGMIVERRDHVFDPPACRSCRSARSTFLSRWSSTNGPFFQNS